MSAEAAAGSPPLARQADSERGKRRRRAILAWLAVALAIFLCLFACGQLAMLGNLPDTDGLGVGSALAADYSSWQTMHFGPLMPGLALEVLRDLGISGDLEVATSTACLLSGECATPTGTLLAGSPTPAGSATPTPLPSPTLAPTSTATLFITATPVTPADTPTITNTPTQTPTPTPLVYPIKLANPVNIPPGATSVQFTIMVINYGNPTGAELTEVIDRLPPEMSFAGGCSPAGCDPGCYGGNEVCWSGSWMIPQGGFRTFRFTVDVAGTLAGDVLTNEVETQGGNFETAVNVRSVYVYTPTPVLHPPVANDDSFVGTEDTPLVIGTPGLLADNGFGPDTDVDGDPLSVQTAPVSGPSHGAVVLNANGSFTYTPAANYYGVDSFVYRVCDPGMLCDTATVTITLAGTADDPVAVDDSYILNEDGSFAAGSPGIRGNDYDPDDLVGPPWWDTLTAYLLVGPAHQDSGIPFSLAPDGSFVYTPADNWNGTDSFSYYACDAGGNGIPEGPASDDRCDSAVVTLTVRSVNDAPSGVDHAVTTPEDVAYVFQIGDFPFSDPNDLPANGLSAVVISTLPASGVLRLSGVAVVPGQAIGVVNIAAGNLTYMPPLNGNGSPFTTFTFRVRDDGGTLLGGQDTDPTPNTQTVNVTPVNDAPLAVADSWQLNLWYRTGEGVDMVVPVPGVLLNDTDVDLDPLTAVYDPVPLGTDAPPVHGSIVVNPDGSFTYTPDVAFHGVDSFTYRAYDGLAYSAPVLVSLLVDDPPVSQPDAFSTTEDTPLSVGSPGVLGDNGFGPDSDANGDGMTVELVSAPSPPAAAFTFNPADGSFSYTPALNYNGPVFFQYRAFDGWLYGNSVAVAIAVAPDNDPPIANPDAVRTPVDTPATIFVLANDTDVDDTTPPSWDQLYVGALTGGVPGSTLTNNTTSVTYEPAPGLAYNDTFNYEACDAGADGIPGNGDDECATAVVSVVVNGPPNGVDDAYSLGEDTLRSVAAPGVLGNDTDPNGDVLTAWLDSWPTHFSLFVLLPNGSFSYRPASNYNGTDSFTYTVCDPDVCDLTPPTTVTLTILPDQDPPIAVDDSASTLEDVAIDIDVLDNDSDPDGDTLTIASIPSPPSDGTATIRDNGTPGDPTDDYIRYRPDLDFFGSDSFDYTIDDGNGGTDTATVTITIAAVNDPPHANDNWYRTDVDTPINSPAPGLLGNDVEPEGQPMTAAWVSGPMPGASAVVNPDGSFTYIPAPGYHGDDSFDYQACDDTAPVPLCEAATVHISMNRPPDTNPDSYFVLEDGLLIVPAPGLLINDSDYEGDVPLTSALLVTSPPSPPSGPFHGVVSVAADGSFTYTPDPGYAGPDDFEYRACDTLGACTTESVSLTVMPENDPPVAVDDPEPPAVYRANVGGSGPLVVAAAEGVLANDTDSDNPPSELRATSPTDPPNGSVSLGADGSFTYTPDPGYAGPDDFSYSVCDPGQDGTPGTPDDLCDIGDVTIEVNGVPNAVNDTYGTNEDIPLLVPAPGVLGNDIEPDSEPLSASLVSGPAGLSFNADGSFSYSPALNFNGAVTFDYEACDVPWGACDTATVTIDVGPINDAPTAVADSAATNWNPPSPLAILVLSNDSDIDGDDVLLDGLITPPPNGSAVRNDNGTPADARDDFFDYMPNPGYSSPPGVPDIFRYRIGDDHGGFATADVSVSVNGPPSASVDGPYFTDEDTPLAVAAPGLLLNDSDPNGDALNASRVSGPGYGAVTVNPDGSFIYTPAIDFSGDDSFTYEACDPGGLCSAETAVSVTVQPVNDPPVAGDDGPYSTDEDTPLSRLAPELLLNDSDPVEGSPVTAAAASGTSAQGGSYTVAADGGFDYWPAGDFFGTDTFTYQAFDGQDPSTPATVTIDVLPVNDAPVARNDSASTNQLQAVTVNVLANDTDVDDPPSALSVQLLAGPAGGTVAVNSDMSVTYTPFAPTASNPATYLEDSFSYRAFDGDDTSAPAIVTIRYNWPDLEVVKDAIPLAPDTWQFIILLVNRGPGTAFFVSVSDDLGDCFEWIGTPSFGSLGDVETEAVVLASARLRSNPPPGCENTNRAEATAANASASSDTVTVDIGTGPTMLSMAMALEPLSLVPPPPIPTLTTTVETSPTVEASPTDPIVGASPTDPTTGVSEEPSATEPSATAEPTDPELSETPAAGTDLPGTDEPSPEPGAGLSGGFSLLGSAGARGPTGLTSDSSGVLGAGPSATASGDIPSASPEPDPILSPAPSPSDSTTEPTPVPDAEPEPESSVTPEPLIVLPIVGPLGNSPAAAEPTQEPENEIPSTEEPPGEVMAAALSNVRWDRLSRTPTAGRRPGIYAAGDSGWLLRYLLSLLAPTPWAEGTPTPNARH